MASSLLTPNRAKTIIVVLLMTAIVAFSPAIKLFAQQTSAVADSNVRIPLSTAFAAIENFPGVKDWWWNGFVSMTAVNSIYHGLFGNAATLPVECPSGNCEWSTPYTTLALTSSCTDLTSSLEPPMDAGEEVGVQLPNGFFLHYNNIWHLPMGERQPYSNMNSTTKAADSNRIHTYEFDSIAYKDTPGKFHSLFTIVGSTPEIAVHESESPPPAAFECILQWCLQRATAKYADGKLTENVQEIITDTINTNMTDFKISRTLTDPENGQLYNVSAISELLMSNILQRMFNGSRESNITGDATPLTSLWNVLARTGENKPDGLYANLASNLATFMRTPNSAIVSANYSYAEGGSVSEVDAVHISWTFLAYSMVVMLLGGLLAFMLVRSLVAEQRYIIIPTAPIEDKN